MENEKAINLEVNPSSNTAITTLIMLANAGYDQASAILEKMGVEKEKVFHGIDRKDMINRPVDIARELRYVALNRTIEESGYQTLMDLPCGYTPKVFEFTEKGMHYIGCDLPAVIDDFAPIIDSMTDEEQKKKIDFAVVDVTNYESLKAAADKADGPVCIATEGLLAYLSSDEKQQLWRNIRRILSEKGGCWLNTDAETIRRYFAVFKAVAGDRAGDLMAGLIKGFSEQSDTDLRSNSSEVLSGQMKGTGESVRMDYEKLEAAYHAAGLLVEKVPYYRDDLELHLFNSMSPEEIEKVRESIKHVNIWKLTVDPAYHEKENADSSGAAAGPVDPGLPFQVKSELKDGVLSVSIQGRMDTITAPELLKQFQEAGEGIRSIHVDVNRMSYVSSAGLRVLLIMYKSLADKDKFEMAGVSKAVREILETTGFDQFLLKE